jgi:tetratricopeptide (TPR) repeat protein
VFFDARLTSTLVYVWIRHELLVLNTQCKGFMVLRKHTVAALLLFGMAFVPFGRIATGQELEALLADARKMAHSGHVAEAIVIYNRAVLRSPNDAEVRRSLARLLSTRIETRVEAEKVFAEAVKLAPNDVPLALERARNLSALGEYVNAALEYSRAFRIAPDQSESLDGYVRQITYLGAAPVIIERLRQDLTDSPVDLAAHLMIGSMLHSEARYNDALDHFLISHRIAPDNPLGLRGAAKSWLALGYTKRAEELYAQFATRAGKSLALADRAKLLIAEGQPELAISLIKNKLSDGSNEPADLLALADAYHLLNQSTQERAVLEKMVVDQAIDTPVADSVIIAMERLARVRWEAGDKDGARSACEKLLGILPDNEICRMGLELIGKRLLTSTNYAPDSQTTPARRAGLDQRISEAAIFWNQRERALTSLRQALTVRADSLHLLLTLGELLLKTGDADGAANAFAQVAISDGNRPDAILGMAEAELLRLRPQQALALYDDALRLSRDNVQALKGQGRALVLMGKPERAALIFSQLVRQAPSNNVANDLLRESLIEFGRTYKTSSSVTDNSRPTGAPQSTERRSNVQSTPIEPRLIAGDKVHVKVSNHPELSIETALDDDAMLDLPFIESAIDANCLTERELGAEIITAAGAKLEGENVEVVISEYQLPSLIVGGAVYLPGKFNVRNNLDLLQALMLASGAKPTAGRVIYVVRGGDRCGAPLKTQAGMVEAYDRTVVESGHLKLEEPLRAGDIVLVTEEQTAFITGDVNRPGIVSTRAPISLLEALRKVGGTRPSARRDSVSLRRLIPGSIAHNSFNINLNNIEQGEVGQIILRQGDVVEIITNEGWEPTRTLAVLVRELARTGHRNPKESVPPTIATSNKAP